VIGICHEKHMDAGLSALHAIVYEPADDLPRSSSSRPQFSLELQAAIRRAKRFAEVAERFRRPGSIATDDNSPLFTQAREAVQFAAALSGSPSCPLASRMVGRIVGAALRTLRMPSLLLHRPQT
jgi:hypothetical protein